MTDTRTATHADDRQDLSQTGSQGLATEANVSVPSVDSDERRIVVLVHSAIAGASIAAVVELASRPILEPLHLISAGAFAAAIPAAIALVVLSSFVFGGNLARRSDNVDWPRASYLLAVLDQIACFVGFATLSFSFHLIVGLVFIAATGMAYGILLVTDRRLKTTA
jgi:hypothetical protein